jgi:hypothetical protein
LPFDTVTEKSGSLPNFVFATAVDWAISATKKVIS